MLSLCFIVVTMFSLLAHYQSLLVFISSLLVTLKFLMTSTLISVLLSLSFSVLQYLSCYSIYSFHSLLDHCLRLAPLSQFVLYFTRYFSYHTLCSSCCTRFLSYSTRLFATLHSLLLTRYSSLATLLSLLFTRYPSVVTLHSLLFTRYSSLFTFHSLLFTRYSFLVIECALNHILSFPLLATSLSHLLSHFYFTQLTHLCISYVFWFLPPPGHVMLFINFTFGSLINATNA